MNYNKRNINKNFKVDMGYIFESFNIHKKLEQEKGYVLNVGDGVAIVQGFESIKAGEMVDKL